MSNHKKPTVAPIALVALLMMPAADVLAGGSGRNCVDRLGEETYICEVKSSDSDDFGLCLNFDFDESLNLGIGADINMAATPPTSDGDGEDARGFRCQCGATARRGEDDGDEDDLDYEDDQDNEDDLDDGGESWVGNHALSFNDSSALQCVVINQNASVILPNPSAREFSFHGRVLGSHSFSRIVFAQGLDQTGVTYVFGCRLAEPDECPVPIPDD